MAAGRVAHSTKKTREKCKTNTGENEDTRSSRRKVQVLKKQAKKARAEPLVNCSLAHQEKEKVKSELHVDGKFTGDREGWREELQGHCEEVYTDQDETREEQENN